MPALGQTSDELVLLAWLKSVGDQVSECEPLLEVETDKATLEVEAAVSGTLLTVVCEPGETVLVGTVVGWIGEPGEQITSEQPAARKVPATPAARTLARERGVDLGGLTGSGPEGRIERRDVLAASGLGGEPEDGVSRKRLLPTELRPPSLGKRVSSSVPTTCGAVWPGTGRASAGLAAMSARAVPAQSRRRAEARGPEVRKGGPP